MTDRTIDPTRQGTHEPEAGVEFPSAPPVTAAEALVAVAGWRASGMPLFGLHQVAVALAAEVERLTDDPQWDATDAAHPAWWRGHDHTTAVFCREATEILDGKEPGGVCQEPWETLRHRLWTIRRQLAALCAYRDSLRQMLGQAIEERENAEAAFVRQPAPRRGGR